MIIEKKFIHLKDELARNVMEFERNDEYCSIHCSQNMNLSDYKGHLNKLQIEFIDELRKNLTSQNSCAEVKAYLTTLLRIFELFKKRLASKLDEVHNDFQISLKTRLNSQVVSPIPSSDQFIKLKEYLNCKYETVIYSIEIIKTCKMDFMIPSGKKSRRKHKSESWSNDFQLFFPEILKIKDELNALNPISKKLAYLLEIKQSVVKKFEDKGKDFYTSPVCLFFEIRCECYRELIANKNSIEKTPAADLTWNRSKSDFLELLCALHQNKAILANSGDPPTRKELIIKFEHFLNVEHIPDADSRISKIQQRSNPCSFLERLQNEIELLSSK